jgi:hypothetical protein
MELNRKIVLSDDVISHEVSGETVLLDLASENYFGLDEVGTRIWQLIQENGDLELIVKTLLDEYDVAEDTLKADVEKLLTEISDLGLIKILRQQVEQPLPRLPSL